MKPDTGWQVAANAALGSRIVETKSLGGGDFATSNRVLLANGRRVFIKTHRQPPPGFFSTEAQGLAWLRDPPAAGIPAEAAAINVPPEARGLNVTPEARGLNVPEVLAVSDDPPFLALQWIDTRGRQEPDEAHFGHLLARLHRRGLACFGRPDARTTGSLALPNEPMQSWHDFYGQQRLLPLARVAAERQALPAKLIADLERLAGLLPALGVPDEPPARLHGDLWAGNRLVDKAGQSWLIDPAAHGGHREFDLAMMRLFGGFGEQCFDAYEKTYPLGNGWRERVALHQLAPLVVHAIKFGGHYVAATRAALERYV